MSGVFAVLDPTGTVGEATVRDAFHEMDYRGPDGRDLVAVDDAHVGHQHFHATPEAVGETQPVDGDGVRLALDGRVDDRAAVRERLADAPDHDCSDAELLHAAYREHGPEVLRHVAGPLGLVVYDADADRLVAARGKIGLREVFYGRCGDALVVASDRSPVLTCRPEPAGVNGRRVAEYVENHTYTPGLTVFEGVRSVPPGHYLVAEDGGVEVRRYFRFTEAPFDAGAGELEARLADLVRDVVGARVRATGAVGTELSGGLDSTTVAAVAKEALGPDRGPPSAYSLVFSDLGDERLARDERDRMRAVADRHDLDLTEIPADDLWPLSDPSVYEPFLLESPCVNQMGTAFARLYDRAAADGVRVLLTGEGGNVFDGKQTVYVDLLRRGKVREAVTSMLRDGTPTWRLLWFAAVKLAGTVGGRFPESRSFGRATLADEFLARVAAEDHDVPAYPQSRFDLLVHQDVHRNKLHSYYLDLLGLSRRVALARGVDVRHPFLDPRVVDFAYSLPKELTMSDGEHKVLFRRFAAEYLPERVHETPTTPSFTPLVTRGLSEERDRVESLLVDGELVARGMADPDDLESLVGEFYRTLPGVEAYANRGATTNADLWRLVTTERWLRRVADSDRVA